MKESFDFLRWRWLYFGFSTLLICLSLAALVIWGLKPGLDFSGGVLIEVEGNWSTIEGWQQKLIEFGLKKSQSSGRDRLIFRFSPLDLQKQNTLRIWFEDKGVKIVRWESLGPVLGKELLLRTLVGIGLAVVGILIYLSFRFQKQAFGVCAILAMLHDTIILLGSFSFLGHFLGVEVDSLFVTAVLTTLSFSVHDTVVVYDRIRELHRLFPKVSLTRLANLALTETMVRSLNNSMTIVFMLIALVLLGGATIRWFATALLIGTLLGTYSSPFVAVPLLVTLYDKIYGKQ